MDGNKFSMKILIKLSGMLFIIAVILALKANLAYANAIEVPRSKDIQFYLSADNTQLQVGVSTNIVITSLNVKNYQLVEIKVIDGIDVFNIDSTNINDIHNRRESMFGEGDDLITQVDTSLPILFYTDGTSTIQAVLECDGKLYYTNELQLVVTKTKKLEDMKVGETFDFIPVTNYSDKSVFVGQKFVIDYSVYTPYSITEVDSPGDISLEHLTVNNSDFNYLNKRDTNINGISCNKYSLARYYITSSFPDQVISIPSNELKFKSLVGDSVKTSKQYNLLTEPVQVRVLPLPTFGRPDDFSGMVGEVFVSSGYNKSVINYGEAVTLEISLYGDCNLEALTSIFPDKVIGFNINESVVYYTEDYYDESSYYFDYNASKLIHIVFTPEMTGEIKIDPVTIYYFSTKSFTYEALIIPGTTITVIGNSPLNTEEGQTTGGQTIRVSKVNYRQLLKDGTLTLLVDLKAVYIAAAVIALLLIILVCFVMYRRSINRDKVLSNIYKEIMHSSDFNDLYNNFNTMMKHCLNLNLKANSRDSIVNSLEKNHYIDREFTGLVLDIIDGIEGSSSNKELITTKGKIKQVFTRIIKFKNKGVISKLDTDMQQGL